MCVRPSVNRAPHFSFSVGPPLWSFLLLRSMGRREVRTKVAVAIFAILMSAIIIGLIVWMNKKTPTDSP